METNINDLAGPDDFLKDSPAPAPPSGGYHDLPGLSHSRLKLLKRNPVLFRKALDEGWETDTKAHHIDGDMIDKLLLDYSAFQKNYVEQTWIKPSSENQINFAVMVAEGHDIVSAYDQSYAANYKPATVERKAKELYEELRGYISYLESDDVNKTPYDERQKEMIMGIQKSAAAHPWVNKLLNHPKKETHKVIQAELLGAPCKCEVDLYIDTGKVVWNIDVKSLHGDLSSFHWDYRKFGYPNQQALYHKLIREDLKRQGRGDVMIKTACIAVEKTEPWSTGLFEIHPRLLVQGWQWIKEGIELWHFHEKHGYEHPRRTIEKGMELITPRDFDPALLAE